MSPVPTAANQPGPPTQLDNNSSFMGLFRSSGGPFYIEGLTSFASSLYVPHTRRDVPQDSHDVPRPRAGAPKAMRKFISILYCAQTSAPLKTRASATCVIYALLSHRLSQILQDGGDEFSVYLPHYYRIYVSSVMSTVLQKCILIIYRPTLLASSNLLSFGK